MPWPQEDNNTPTTVTALLAQILTLHTQCMTQLNLIGTHRTRCLANAMADATHAEPRFHGQDGSPVRPQAYMNLVNVRTQLTALVQQLTACRTEMSHGGNP